MIRPKLYILKAGQFKYKPKRSKKERTVTVIIKPKQR